MLENLFKISTVDNNDKDEENSQTDNNRIVQMDLFKHDS